MNEPTDHTDYSEFLDWLYEQHGIDFRDYAKASLHRRILAAARAEKLISFAEIRRKIASDKLFLPRFIHTISVKVTSMFRDPSFYKSLREQILPTLKTYPFVRIWHAGCATGEEVYSMAIMLYEEGLQQRTKIYATDLDALALESAKRGIYSVESLQEYSENYQEAGGKHRLADYFTADQQNARINEFLKTNIIFAPHNLASDASFNEFHVILCRNVLIYFDNPLRDRVLSLFNDSLVIFGILGLGSKESLQFSCIQFSFEQINGREKLYKKISG